MRRRASAGAIVIVAVAFLAVGSVPAAAGNVLAQISVPSGTSSRAHYNELYVFPEDVRDYSNERLFGYGFREARGETAFREVQLAQVRTRSAYLMVTDFFGNGRFSSMGHTALFVFPRDGAGGYLYEVEETPGGDVLVDGPDETTLRIDGRSGAVLESRGFHFRPPGRPGTAPGVSYRGFALRLQSVGKSPFLRGATVLAEDGRGGRCRLTTNELFRYDGDAESDRLRFDTDEALFDFLAGRCPGLEPPELPDDAQDPTPGPVPVSTQPDMVVDVENDDTSGPNEVDVVPVIYPSVPEPDRRMQNEPKHSLDPSAGAIPYLLGVFSP